MLQYCQYCQYCHNAIANIAEEPITNYNPANWLQNKGHGVELAKTDSVNNNGKKIGMREATNPTSRTTTLAVAMIKSISMYLFFFTYLVVSRWLIYSEIEKSQQQSQKQSRFAIVIMLLLYTRTMISVLMFHFCVQRNSSWVVFNGW